jgi:hypothetical protein
MGFFNNLSGMIGNLMEKAQLYPPPSGGNPKGNMQIGVNAAPAEATTTTAAPDISTQIQPSPAGGISGGMSSIGPLLEQAIAGQQDNPIFAKLRNLMR